MKYRKGQNRRKTMLNIGITNKVKIQLDPSEGFPKIIAVNRILQGEPIETVCAHDLNMLQAKLIFSLAPEFSNTIQTNPIKLKQLNFEMDKLANELRTELLESDANVTPKALENIQNDQRLIDKLHGYHWLDFLTGNISTYTVSDYPNAVIDWNDQIKTWQVVAATEILPDQIISLPKPKDI